MSDYPVHMSLVTPGTQPRGAGLWALIIAVALVPLAAGCTRTPDSPAGSPSPDVRGATQPGPAPQKSAFAHVPEPYDRAWHASLSESLDFQLWRAPGFLETWASELREQQVVHRGELPLLLPDFQWTPLAQAIMNEAARVEGHGLDPSNLPEGLIETLRDLRERLHELPPLVGFPVPDSPRVLAAVHADQALTHLLMILTDLLGAGGSTPPWSRIGVQRRVFDATPTWHSEPQLVDTLGPPMRAYSRLRAALARYEEIAAQGGFVELDLKRLSRTRPRRRHRTLSALRKRLAQEDPLVNPEGDTWDDEMTESLRRAREAHQLKRTGPRSRLVDQALLKALSVPVERRIATIKQNLARWRASEARFHDYAFQVNLPDYHGEFWNGDELIRRFKVVIGSARKTRETGEMRNATPRLSSAIRTVIFNPYWNVPERILLEELLPQAQRALTRDADEREAQGETVDREELLSTESIVEYFNGNGYEVLNQTPSGRLWIRQLPGPTNALGKVKFIFPNRYSVFMHDTPSKGKFRFPRRAFSHGCVRVHKPLELARILLERDGSWSPYRSRKALRSETQLVIPLESPVRVIVDYITNHVDDDDRVHWLHDIYGYDQS